MVIFGDFLFLAMFLYKKIKIKYVFVSTFIIYKIVIINLYRSFTGRLFVVSIFLVDQSGCLESKGRDVIFISLVSLPSPPVIPPAEKVCPCGLLGGDGEAHQCEGCRRPAQEVFAIV